ncbi:unnamed protein product [Orchesella dallaii]|uniref:Uncharacterized protein n=1 Tax=Orchesella dallaii TaxID=48710 RepID=A0ABP1RPI6_9HEXA
MRSKKELDTKCFLRSLIVPSAEVLQERRRASSSGGHKDELGSNVPFTDPARISWTKCLCHNNINECRKMNPSQPNPETPKCFDYGNAYQVEARYYSWCNITEKNKTGYWYDVAFMVYPAIFQKDRFGHYEQKMKPGLAEHCHLFRYPYHPFLAESVNPFLPVYDCRQEEFKPGQSYFEDECRNPILYKKGTHWNRFQFARIHIAYLNMARVACCVNYGGPNEAYYRNLTMVCTTPSKKVSLEKWCRNPQDSLRDSIIGTYLKKWNEVKNKKKKLWIRLSTDFFIVRCMCGGVLEYVQKIYPVEENGVKHPLVNQWNCEKRIKTIV